MNRSSVFTFPRVTMAVCAVAACTTTSSLDPRPPRFLSQAIVAGAVRDTVGGGVANAAVCAVAAFTISGTFVTAVGQGVTSSNGAFVVPINLTFRADVRGSVTVAATPTVASGLEPAYKPGLSMLVTTTLPPVETTHVDLVVVKGAPANNVFCISGAAL